MVRNSIPIISGQIRHPHKLPNMLGKCRGPIPSETSDKEGNSIPTEMFYLTNDFPTPHYILIDRILNNYLYPEHPFALVYLITHSDGYENVKVTENLYSKNDTKLNLTKSYVTRDTFVVLLKNIDKFKVFGHFYMDRLRDTLKY